MLTKKLKIMTYEFVMFKDRAPFLVKELGDKVTIGEIYKEDMVIVTVNIESSTDLLSFFRAGIKYGLEVLGNK